MSEKAEDKIRMSYEQRISELDDRLKEETSLRKKVEEELARIKKSLDSTSDAIGMSTPNGDHFYHNKAFSELFGFDTPEDLHAAGGGPVVYIDADVGREVFETIISGKSWSGEIEMASKSGRRIPVALRADAIKDEEGGIVGLIGVHTDITEQKKTELELLRILKAIESTSDAIGMSTPQGDHFFQNKAFSELFGFDTPEDLRTAGGGPVVYTDADVGREVFETIMSGKSWSGEIEMASKSGRRFPVALRADAIKDDEGKIIGLIGVHTDITERKKAEEELKRHRDHLEELVQERTEQLEVIQSQLIKTAHTAGQAEIATSVLHNVGNILNSVVTSSAMMMRTIEKSNSSKLVKANNLLRGNINNLDSFIQNDPKGKKLLDYYQMLENSLVQQDGTLLDQVNRIKEKIELIEAEIVAQQSYASGAVLTEEVFLQDVIVDAFQIKERSISKKNIQVEKRWDDVPKVLLQRMKLIHIIINLIKNAEDALAQNRIDERKIVVELTQNKGGAILRFSDNGVGIKKGTLVRLFNQGFTTKTDGHGFGLHSSANYMKEMGGRIWAESEGEGTGATFVLEFGSQA